EIQVRNGFAPPMLITPYLVGHKQAKEIMLLGEVYDAAEALRLGLVNRVVADDELETVAGEIALKLAALPQNVVRLNKALVNRVYRLAGMEQGLAWRKDEAMTELADARDSVAAERQRIRSEQGWNAFKQERDR